MKNKIFLDYAATTPIREAVARVIIDEYQTFKVNKEIENTKDLDLRLTDAKIQISKLIGCSASEICLTACGSESNNAVIKSVAYALPKDKRHIITTEIEHPSVLNVFKQLEKDHFDVTYLKVDDKGKIKLDAFYDAVTQSTGLVSTMFYNNEMGSRQPVEAIGTFLREKGIFYHVDGVQAVYNEEFEASKLPVDAMSFSAHKLYGPKGIGGLYVKTSEGNFLSRLKAYFPYSQHAETLIFTENTPYIMGFARACEIAYQDRAQHIGHLKALRNYFIQAVHQLNANIKINGFEEGNHPGIVNIMLPQMDADSAMINLDMLGYAVSTGSACSSGAVSASHVLLALGLTEKEAKRSLRISMGHFTSFEDVDGFVEALKTIV